MLWCEPGDPPPPALLPHKDRLIARRILCYVKAGDQLARGQRYGFIRFGSRVDVYLPLDAAVKVSIGDKVSATSTILAILPQS